MNPSTTTLPRDGDWEHLREPSQVHRYEAYARLIGTASTVLDVGAGMGVLKEYLPADTFYHGIESSMAAIYKARRGTFIEHATAETFTTDGAYDCIVLAEVLYYCRDPLAILDKYVGFLAPGGKFVISIYQQPQRWPNWVYALRGKMTDLRCQAMVLAHIRKRGWRIDSDGVVPRPGGGAWRILTIIP